MKTITKEQLIEKLEAKTDGIYIFYGAGGTGKTTFIRELQKKYNIAGARFERVTKPKLRHVSSLKIEGIVLIESNQLPTKGAEDFIEGIINFDELEAKP